MKAGGKGQGKGKEDEAGGRVKGKGKEAAARVSGTCTGRRESQCQLRPMRLAVTDSRPCWNACARVSYATPCKGERDPGQESEGRERKGNRFTNCKQNTTRSVHFILTQY